MSTISTIGTPPVAEARETVKDTMKAEKAKVLVQKMIDDKKAINQFLRGEISSDVLDAKGIKFVKAV
jgi:hypothetical protein